MVVTAHRISGKGSVNVVVETGGSETVIRIFGLGEPTEVHAPQQMSRLKEIIVEQHDGQISPDSMGPFGTGIVLKLRREPYPAPRLAVARKSRYAAETRKAF